MDALAIAVGTSHGAYKFTRPPTGDILAIDRIKEIHEALPNTHIVMHGSSSVPQKWLKLSTKTVVILAKLMAFLLSNWLRRSSTVCVKLISIPTYAWQSTGAVRKFLNDHPAESLIHANI